METEGGGGRGATMGNFHGHFSDSRKLIHIRNFLTFTLNMKEVGSSETLVIAEP
jgi:hypothetical protein